MEEIDTIRFVAPGHEHDILYTMSSGQLSGILLSFSLALNKIYVRDGIKTIFVDDPVQSMDELNMASFVELLHSEFPDSQILISTHENIFSSYAKYKYEKYDCPVKVINLKDEAI